MTMNVTYRATVYVSKGIDPGETTPLTPFAGTGHSDQFKVATREGIAGFQPYMGMPSGRRGRIDPLSKKTDTGEIGFEILDQRVTPGGSNAVRWVTSFVGDAKGLPRFTRLRCFVEESLDGGATWAPFFTGRIRGIRLKEGSRLSYAVTVRDFSDDLTYQIFTGAPHERVRATSNRAVTSATGTTLTDSGQAWATDEKAGTPVTIVSGPGMGQVRTVSSNTATVLTVSPAWSTNPTSASRYYVGYAQLVSVMPVGFVRPYGNAPITTDIGATVKSIAASGDWALLSVNSADRGRIENLMTQTLVSATFRGFGIGPNDIPESANPSHDTTTPSFSGIAMARVLRTDTNAEGDFMVGYGSTTSVTRVSSLGGRVITTIVKTVWSLAIKPLAFPIGVATGTPLANGATSSSAASLTQAVPMKGWTISITGIVKQGDILSFSGHAQRYMVQADANSDGSGNATVTLSPGLQANVADNEVITVQRSPGRMALPAAATPIKFHVFCDMPLSDGTKEGKPGNVLLVNDVHAAIMLKDAVSGLYGYQYRPVFDASGSGSLPVGLSPGKNLGDPISTVAVQLTDAAGDGRHGFNALIADQTFPSFRCIVDKQMSIRDFIEQYICKPHGIGYYFDASGNFVPVDMRQPAAIPAGIVTVTDADLVDDKPPGWAYDATAAVTRGAYTLYAEAIVQPIAARIEPGDQYPQITSRMFDVQAATIRDGRLGNLSLSDKEYAVDFKGYRAMAGENTSWTGANGETTSGSRFQRVEQQAVQMAHANVQRPYGNGPITVSLTVVRNANTAGIYPGSFFKLAIASNPDPASNTRGPERLVLCLERAEEKAAARLTAVDWGLASNSNAPTLGTPATFAGDASHSCQCAVTLNAQNEAAEAWINVTETSVGARPADADPNWFRVGSSWTSWIALARGLPSGKRVWWRARTLPARLQHIGEDLIAISSLKGPSAWGYGVTFVDLSTLSAPTGLASSAATSSGFRVTWANPDPTRQVEVWMATPVGDPRRLIALLPPGSTRYDFRGLGASTTYRVGVRTVDGVGGFAEATIDVATTGLAPSIQPPFSTRGTPLMV